MTQALYFIVSTIAQLVLLLFLLRFWMPLLRVDFRNPLAQGILRITSPVIVPVRRLLPPVGRVDTATVLGNSRVAFNFNAIEVFAQQNVRNAGNRIRSVDG